MTPAQQLVADLRTRSTGRSRVDRRQIWEAFTELRPDDARSADARQRLAGLLDDANRAGLVRSSTATDRISPTPLPCFVTLIRHGPPKPPVRRTPWRPELAWANKLTLTSKQHDMLDRVNRWLRDGGAARPVVPAEERSIELFDNEKAIAAFAGGQTTLWSAGRLGPDLLRYENAPMPFAYRQVGNGSRLLMVENTAAFRSCSRALRETPGHPYHAVAFGQGASAPATLASVSDLPAATDAVDYWGDLDVNGLTITRNVINAGTDIGIPTQAHPTLWRLMLACKPDAHSKAPRSFDASLVEVLPVDLRPTAVGVLRARTRIAQERVGYEILAATVRWWQPT